MKTLFVIASYWPAIGGAQLHTRELAKNISQMQDVKVLHFSATQGISNEMALATSQERVFYDGNVQTIQTAPHGMVRMTLIFLAFFYSKTKLIRPFFHYLVQRYAHHQIKQYADDCDVIHSIYNGITSITEAAAQVAKEKGIPLVFCPLSSDGEMPGQAWSSKRFITLFQRADRIIALTSHEAKRIASFGIAADKITIIPMGPLLQGTSNLQRFRSKYQLPECPIVLFLARVVPEKGYQLLADAMSIVWQVQPATRFVFMGPQNKSSRRKLMQYKDPRVIAIEDSCQQLKYDAINACDCLCVPTHKEGLGVVFLEAWMCNKPVIAGDIQVLRSVIDDGLDGLLVPHSAHSIARALIRLLSDQKLAHRLAYHGHRKVTRDYQWSHIAQQTSCCYQTLHQLFNNKPRRHFYHANILSDNASI